MIITKKMNFHLKCIIMVSVCMFVLSCKNQKITDSDNKKTTEIEVKKQVAETSVDENTIEIPNEDETWHPPVNNTTDESVKITDELLKLEAEYTVMLQPISGYKESDPKMYWFIVSWLKTNYRTPDWTGYTGDGSNAWRLQAKKKGIDCSGFTRIMQDEVFAMKIAGGSQGLLDNYCDRISSAQKQLGDLVFFRAPYSKSDRIVHVGVYLKDGYFVHATSTKSAAKGLGLKIDTLTDKRWGGELVAIGRVKSEFSN